MQAIFESVFDGIYLVSILIMGIYILKNSKGEKQFRLFGVMALVLGLGDAFHLVPRACALLTDGLAAHTTALGIGKFITSITMTVFYVLLYHVWRSRYSIKQRSGLTIVVYLLAGLRIALCLFPQNAWLESDSPVIWGIYRNLPFAAMGILLIVLFYQEAKKQQDKDFRFMWLAITLSFLLYAPVVLWADQFPLVGMLMIPKTLAYVWVVWMGLKACRKA